MLPPRSRGVACIHGSAHEAAPASIGGMDLRLPLTTLPAECDRAQSRAEEFANTLSHGLGIALALAAWPLLADAARRQSGTLGVVGVALFCASMLMQYLASTF